MPRDPIGRRDLILLIDRLGDIRKGDKRFVDILTAVRVFQRPLLVFDVEGVLCYRGVNAREGMIMIEVEDLSEQEADDLLGRMGYGHLGCCLNERPYVVPVHFAFDQGTIYIYTTEGKKAAMISENPNVCLQVEEVVNNEDWRSVIVDGVAEDITDGPERDRAMELIVEVSPTLTPAISVRWMDHWVRENIEVLYRVRPTAITGRRAGRRMGNKPFVPPTAGSKDNLM